MSVKTGFFTVFPHPKMSVKSGFETDFLTSNGSKFFAPWSRGRVPKLRNVHKLHTYDQIVSRHVPIWGDWRPKLTNLTKSLNSTRPTEGTFYRPHVVFCNARHANSEISTSFSAVLWTDRLYAIPNLRTSRHSLQTFWTGSNIIFGIQ